MFSIKTTAVARLMQDLDFTTLGTLEECSICLDAFGRKPLRQVSCNGKHVFHRKCIKNWYKINRCCPLCRQAQTRACKYKLPVLIDLTREELTDDTIDLSTDDAQTLQ